MATRRPQTDVDREISRRIQLRRLELGMSQVELGRRLGVTFQQVGKYETGANRLSAGMLHRAAVALDVAPAHFFPAPDEALGAAPPLSRLGHELLRLFGGMDADRQRSLVRVARAMTPDDTMAAA